MSLGDAMDYTHSQRKRWRERREERERKREREREREEEREKEREIVPIKFKSLLVSRV